MEIKVKPVAHIELTPAEIEKLQEGNVQRSSDLKIDVILGQRSKLRGINHERSDRVIIALEEVELKEIMEGNRVEIIASSIIPDLGEYEKVEVSRKY